MTHETLTEHTPINIFALRDPDIATFFTRYDDSTVALGGNNGLFENNVIAATEGTNVGFGLRVSGNGNTVRNNVVRDLDSGIEICGDFNVVERNLITGALLGLSFSGLSEGNVYRGNTSRGNSTNFLDEGTNNTSHGDNYMPGRM